MHAERLRDLRRGLVPLDRLDSDFRLQAGRMILSSCGHCLSFIFNAPSPSKKRSVFVQKMGSTSAFLCADLELTPEVREDHAAYIASWLTALKNDKRAIFQAASHAQRAVDFLHGLQQPKAEAA